MFWAIGAVVWAYGTGTGTFSSERRAEAEMFHLHFLTELD